jgi:hypothetical protein
MKLLSAPRQQRSGIISPLYAGEYLVYSPFIRIAAAISTYNCRQRLAPLAQSVERIHGKEKPGTILLVR